MTNKIVASIGLVLLIGGLAMTVVISVIEDWVRVGLVSVPACDNDGESPIGTLGLYSASFNTECTKADDVPEAITESYATALNLDSVSTTDFYPLFPSSTGFGGQLDASYGGKSLAEEFESCEQFYTADGPAFSAAAAAVSAQVTGGLKSNYAKLEATLDGIVPLVDSAIPGIWAESLGGNAKTLFESLQGQSELMYGTLSLYIGLTFGSPFATPEEAAAAIQTYNMSSPGGWVDIGAALNPAATIAADATILDVIGNPDGLSAQEILAVILNTASPNIAQQTFLAGLSTICVKIYETGCAPGGDNLPKTVGAVSLAETVIYLNGLADDFTFPGGQQADATFERIPFPVGVTPGVFASAMYGGFLGTNFTDPEEVQKASLPSASVAIGRILVSSGLAAKSVVGAIDNLEKLSETSVAQLQSLKDAVVALLDARNLVDLVCIGGYEMPCLGATSGVTSDCGQVFNGTAYTTVKECSALFGVIPADLNKPWGLCQLATATEPYQSAKEDSGVTGCSTVDLLNVLGYVIENDPSASPLAGKIDDSIAPAVPLLIDYVNNCGALGLPWNTSEPASCQEGLYDPTVLANVLSLGAYPIAGREEQAGIPSDFNMPSALCLGLKLENASITCTTFSDVAANSEALAGWYASYLAPCLAGGLTTKAACDKLYADNELTGASPAVYAGVLAKFIEGDNITALVKSCEDDVEDARRIGLAQVMVPIAIALEGVSVLLAVGLVATGKKPLAFAAGILTLGGMALTLSSLLLVRGAPVYANVGDPKDPVKDFGTTIYTAGSASLLGLIAIALPAIAAPMLIFSTCCGNEEEDEDQLTSKVENSY